MPSAVTTCHRARRRWAWGSHQRSSTGHGPAHALIPVHRPPSIEIFAGSPDAAPLPLTVTGWLFASTTSARIGLT